LLDDMGTSDCRSILVVLCGMTASEDKTRPVVGQSRSVSISPPSRYHLDGE
jgi:hypothetical protein